MKDVIYLLFDLLTTLAKLLRPGGSRTVIAVHYKPDPGNQGPSWLTTIGHAKDSLWSVDLIRCESILLKSHWVMVIMDQTFFWTATDLENKLRDYKCYYNENRCHSGRDGATPVESGPGKVVDIKNYCWKKHCRGLFQLPKVA